MIHAFALEPKLVASWATRAEFRLVHDKFGLGTPRVLLEVPDFVDWKNAVYLAASEMGLTDTDLKRLELLFGIFTEHRCRRDSGAYDALVGWLENAEHEHKRLGFRAILATENPRRHSAVVIGEDVGLPKAKLWACETRATLPRRSADVAARLSAMLKNCRALHLVDPHFGPENSRHRNVLEALAEIVAGNETPTLVRLHCGDARELKFFEEQSAAMAERLPTGLAIEFVRWRERRGSEQLHNRYVLTDLGGVALGAGLDEGKPGETDDLFLLSRSQYELRWSQYVRPAGAFDLVDRPKRVVGTRGHRPAKAR